MIQISPYYIVQTVETYFVYLFLCQHKEPPSYVKALPATTILTISERELNSIFIEGTNSRSRLILTEWVSIGWRLDISSIQYLVSSIYIPMLLLGKCAVILLCIITDSNEETETCNNELSNIDLLPQLKLDCPAGFYFTILMLIWNRWDWNS